MTYYNCLTCSRKVSASFSKYCHNCASIKNLEELLLKVSDHNIQDRNYNNLLKEFIVFIKKADHAAQWKYRVVLTFKKVLELQIDFPIREKELDNLYKGIKTETNKSYLFIFKLFLFAKRKLEVEDEFKYLKTNISDYYFINDNILEYFYDHTKCKVCGVEKILKIESVKNVLREHH